MWSTALRWLATCVHDTCDNKRYIEHRMIHTFTSATLSSRALGGKKFCRSYASESVKEHEVYSDHGPNNTSPNKFVLGPKGQPAPPHLVLVAHGNFGHGRIERQAVSVRMCPLQHVERACPRVHERKRVVSRSSDGSSPKRVSENCGRGQGITHHSNPDLDGA